MKIYTDKYMWFSCVDNNSKIFYRTINIDPESSYTIIWGRDKLRYSMVLL